MTNFAELVRQTRGRFTELVSGIDPDAAAWLKVKEKHSASVVVVGETNRGKSSLVNALLATPGLSPVDAEVATATYLIFRHGAQWSAQACYDGGTPSVGFDITELPQWASAASQLPDGAIPPRYIEIQAPVPLLANLSIVDTPGVGGLNSAHGELAAQAAASATALLFVVDASAPFTRNELQFLRSVSERVETVVFTLTKVDQFRGWQEILDANKALLTEHAPRFADAIFYPVSARMFELASNAPNPDTAAMLRQRSGIADLQRALQELVVGKAAMLVEANALRALATVLDELVTKVETECRRFSSGESEVEELHNRREELNIQRRSSTRSWQVKLRSEVARVRVEVNHEVSRQTRDVLTWARTAIVQADREKLAAIPQEVDAALQLMSSRISTGLTVRLAQIADTVMADLFTAAELKLIRGQFARALQPPVVLRTPEDRLPTAEDRLMIFMGVTGGIGVGRLAALPLAGLSIAASPIILPVTIAIGLGAGWWIAKIRKHAVDKQHMKQWLTDALADARSTVDQLVAEQLIEAEQQLSLALDDALAKRIDAIDDELREVDKALRMEASERAKALTTASERLAALRGGQTKVAELLAKIRQLRDRKSDQQVTLAAAAALISAAGNQPSQS